MQQQTPSFEEDHPGSHVPLGFAPKLAAFIWRVSKFKVAAPSACLSDSRPVSTLLATFLRTVCGKSKGP